MKCYDCACNPCREVRYRDLTLLVTYWPTIVVSSNDVPVGRHLGLQASNLSRREPGHARVIGIVHVVVLRKGSTPLSEQVSRPTGLPLAGEASGEVSDGVATATASTLGGVVEADPVTDFVCQGLAVVVVRGRSSRQGRG